MASFSVQYIFTLLDRFTPNARNLGKSAQQMSNAVHAAGRRADAAAAGVMKYVILLRLS